MNLFLNDLSFHGQFETVPQFQDSIDRLMRIRKTAKDQFDRQILCHKNMKAVKITADMFIQEVVSKHLPRDMRVPLMEWLLRTSSWTYKHDPDEIWTYDDDGKEELATDAALAEAAFLTANGEDCHLISITPSRWTKTPICVRREEPLLDVEVENHIVWETLEHALRETEKPIKNWGELEEYCRRRFTSLVFANDAFEPLWKEARFSHAESSLFVRLFDALDKLKRDVDDNGERSEDGRRIYESFFKGGQPSFTDSSDSEKNDSIFRLRLTFARPEHPGEMIECFWHGKTRYQQLRFHFNWPINADTPLYIVYVGPKITKK